MNHELDMACIGLTIALGNPEAVKRYTIMHAAQYEHPDWVVYRDKHTVRKQNNGLRS